MMTTSTFLAAALAVVSPLALQTDTPGKEGPLVRAASGGEAGCNLEPGTWLPGTLEIKERSRSAPPQGQTPGAGGDPPQHDCGWA